MFRKFEREMEGMYSCFSTRRMNVNGSIITYVVKAQIEVDGLGGKQETTMFFTIHLKWRSSVFVVSLTLEDISAGMHFQSSATMAWRRSSLNTFFPRGEKILGRIMFLTIAATVSM